MIKPTGGVAGNKDKIGMTHSATYSPEDNKLRLYAAARLDSETYQRVRAAGFIWAPKQELFVAPSWSPAREDLLLELCDEIEDEDKSPEERAADRAERFSDYRDKRRDEAGESADTFEAGPQVFGHQNRQRAERQAARHDRHRTYAGSQWSKAEYWQTRTEGVIRHALHKSSAAVRRSRLLRLEAEQRKHEKSRKEYAERFASWQKVLTLDGAETDTTRTTPAGQLAYALANYHCWGDYLHPRTGQKQSMYSLLTNADPITPAEAARLWLDKKPAPDSPDTYMARASSHYALRIGYELAMLANEGGNASETNMEPGGWIGRHQIHAVNRSPVTGRVVSVKLMAEKPWYRGEPVLRADGTYGAPLTLQSFNIERMGESAYRAPTDEERAAFAADTKERKAKAKASKPAAPSLVNPTDADAERLQAALNDKERARHEKAKAERRTFDTFEPSEVLRMTQAKYSELSRGTYSSFEARTLHAGDRISRRHSNMYSAESTAYAKSIGAPLCKVRIYSGGSFYKADRVVVLTDKPQKPFPASAPAVVEAVEVLTH